MCLQFPSLVVSFPSGVFFQERLEKEQQDIELAKEMAEEDEDEDDPDFLP